MAVHAGPPGLDGYPGGQGQEGRVGPPQITHTGNRFGGGGVNGACRILKLKQIGTHGIHTANEGPVRIQCKCLVHIYVFPEMKLLFPKHNYNVMSPNSYTHISVRDLYISRIGLPILLQGNMWTNNENI